MRILEKIQEFLLISMKQSRSLLLLARPDTREPKNWKDQINQLDSEQHPDTHINSIEIREQDEIGFD
jgi:hypothetical protein